MFQVATHFIQQYTTNVSMLLQQQGGKLTPYVNSGSYTGIGAQVVQQIGVVAPTENLGRLQDTPLMDVPTAQRWVFPTDWDWGTLIDDQDKLRLLLDPTSPYTQAGVISMRRAQDETILRAFYAASATGTNGGSTTAFDSNQIVGVNTGGTNSGLNVAKLRAARRLLLAAGADLDSEQPVCAITAQDHDQLLNEVQVQSMEFNTKPVLVDGKVTEFMGFRFIIVEFTSTDYSGTTRAAMLSGSNRLVPVWLPSGMHLGNWKGLSVQIAPRPDKRFATQVYMTQTLGATRLEEKRVVQIVCA
ncbi:MAG: hypothetical protein INH13_25695 [Cupriavidus sp.]|nr:hypothetical protein [Cupriavidus sp.]